MNLLQLIINGLTIGSIYALMGVGLSLVWATLRSLNFAHGDIYMIGAFASVSVAASVVGALLGGNPYVVALIAVVIAALVGAVLSMATERAIFRPLRTAPDVIPILATVGVSIVLQNVMLRLRGPNPVAYPIDVPRISLSVGEVRVNVLQVVAIVFTILAVLALDQFLNRSRTGRAMRAIAWDRDTAKLMGVNTDLLILVAFGIAGAFAGVAGAFVAFYYGVTTFFMGFIAVVKGFIAAVVGGFGNIRGALLGGLMLGIIESFAAGYIGGRWRDVIAFSLLMVVLVIRPTGILGEKLPTKV